MKGISTKLLNKYYKNPTLLPQLGYFLDNNKSIIRDSSSKKKTLIQSFYEDKYTKPYTALQAYGPLIKTNNSKILYDVGGYGMLGFGHNHKKILDAIAKPQVMANIMTPNEIQHTFSEKIINEIGNKRVECPYKKFMFLNSGSEANTLALTIANIHSYRKNCVINIKDAFHGRTEMPARLSDSIKNNYKCMERSYYNNDIVTVSQNNKEEFYQKFMDRINNNYHIEAVIMEPVMGEGNPGESIDPEFYKLIRDTTSKYDSLLLIDSVQAGFRCTGELSIVDYDGFTKLDAPDIETFSKAINGGQFPLSLLALSEKASSMFRPGIYGNTMTANPRGLEVMNTILDLVTIDLKNNILDKGNYLYDGFTRLSKKYEFIEKVTGRGLLLAIHIDPKLPIDRLEYELRLNGLNVIHGGKNALRFTPWFYISTNECDLILEVLDDYFKTL